MGTLLFLGPDDALCRAVTDCFAEHSYHVERVTPSQTPSSPARLESFFNERIPDVVMIRPSWQGRGAFLESTSGEWEEAIAQNIETVTLLLQAAAKRLATLQNGGRILVSSHVAALMPFHGLSLLGTTLAAVTALVKMLALEMAPHGITVNAVAGGPGLEGLPQTSRERLHQDIPLKGDAARSLVSLCLFLASEGASHITGQTLSVEGGFLLTRGAGVSPYVERSVD